MSTSITHSLPIQVEYNQTDGQGRVHHGQYVNYFERGRVELFRQCGFSYREFEKSGLFLVVTELNIQYHGGAEFDDRLELTTTLTRVRGVRIQHRYDISRPAADSHTKNEHPSHSAERIVTGTTTVACIDHAGKVRPLPAEIRAMGKQLMPKVPEKVPER